MNLKLDVSRNKLLSISIVVRLVDACFTFGAFIGGVFGAQCAA